MTEKLLLGKSFEGRDIELLPLCSAPQKPSVLLVSGVHGDEPEGYEFTRKFLKEARWKEFKDKLSLNLIPEMNPDAVFRRSKDNARGVDLNRNTPTSNWKSFIDETHNPGPEPESEIETKVFLDHLRSFSYDWVISFHSYKKVMINYDGPALPLAELLSKETGYPVTTDMGYPTPGSHGSWAAEQEPPLPWITYEFLRDAPAEEMWKLHEPALMKALQWIAREKDS